MKVYVPDESENPRQEWENWKKKFTSPENLKHVILADDVVELITNHFNSRWGLKTNTDEVEQMLQEMFIRNSESNKRL